MGSWTDGLLLPILQKQRGGFLAANVCVALGTGWAWEAPDSRNVTFYRSWFRKSNDAPDIGSETHTVRPLRSRRSGSAGADCSRGLAGSYAFCLEVCG